MSTLKFKSKIEVPGIDVKGGNITNIGQVVSGNGKTVIDEAGSIFTDLISPSDEQDFVMIKTTKTLPAQINYIKSQQILLNDTETNASTAIGTKLIRTPAINVGSPGATGYTSVERYSGGLRYTDLNSTDKIQNIILSDQNFSNLINATDVPILPNINNIPVQSYTVKNWIKNSLGGQGGYQLQFVPDTDKETLEINLSQFPVQLLTCDLISSSTSSEPTITYSWTNQDSWQEDQKLKFTIDLKYHSSTITTPPNETIEFKLSPTVGATVGEVLDTILFAKQISYHYWVLLKSTGGSEMRGCIIGSRAIKSSEEHQDWTAQDIASVSHQAILYTSEGSVPCSVGWNERVFVAVPYYNITSWDLRSVETEYRLDYEIVNQFSNI